MMSVPIILVVANDGLAIGLPNLCVVGGKFDCFIFLIFISLTKMFLHFPKQVVMSSHVSFQMPMGGWMKWNSKSKLAQDLECTLAFWMGSLHWRSRWNILPTRYLT